MQETVYIRKNGSDPGLNSDSVMQKNFEEIFKSLVASNNKRRVVYGLRARRGCANKGRVLSRRKEKLKRKGRKIFAHLITKKEVFEILAQNEITQLSPQWEELLKTFRTPTVSMVIRDEKGGFRVEGERPAEVFVIGSQGSGKVSHPWDYLKPCACGCKERPLMLYNEKELYYCGGPTDVVYIKCPICGRHTEKKDNHYVIDAWNNDAIKKG